MPRLLEQSLLSGNPGCAQIASGFTHLIRHRDATANAPVPDMVDMTDAEAQAAMKKAVEIDALANLELQAAEQIAGNCKPPLLPPFWKLRPQHGS